MSYRADTSKYACQNGHYEALNAFVPFLTDINTVHRALAWSAKHGRSKLVERLLKCPGIDVNAKVRGDTALYLACKTADQAFIATLLEAGADPTILCEPLGDEFRGVGSAYRYYPDQIKDETRGYTALHALCYIGHRGHMSTEKVDPNVLQKLFSLLLQKGANIHQRTMGGSTALHYAVSSTVLTRLLLRAGADANSLDDRGRVPLHEVRSPEMVELLVEEGHANINQIIPSDGNSPLLCMLGGYDTDVVLKFLEYHPDMTVKDKECNGPLHVALAHYRHDTTIVKALLAAGADPNERNRAGETPLMTMRLDDRDSVATTDVLIAAGADVNARDPLGMTILSRAMGSSSSASRSDHWDLKSLLERGANLHVRDNKGRTLLHKAVSSHEGRSSIGYQEKVVTRLDFLLGLGMDVHTTDYSGNTLFHEAALRGSVLDSYSGPQYIPLWEQLLALGLDLDQNNHQGRTALHVLAATHPGGYRGFSTKPGHLGPLEWVISKTKNINQRDHKGLSALHLASTVSEYTTKKLLDGGADPTLVTFDGLTPLSLAIRARHCNIVGLLLECSKKYGSDPVHIRDEKGRSALYYACRSGRPESLRLLLDAGANASQEDLYTACAEFEEEERLWGQKRHPADAEANQSASGLTIDDTTRPVTPPTDYRQQRGVQSTVRLEEIMDMLQGTRCVFSGPTQNKSGHGSTTLESAANSGHDYTLVCLLRVREDLPEDQKPVTTSVTHFAERMVMTSRDAHTSAAVNLSGLKVGEANQGLIIYLLKRRQFHAIRALFDQGVDYLVGGDITNLHLFIEHGYASLLDEIGSLEVERKLSEGKWHAFGDKTKPGLYTAVDIEALQEDYHNHDPLLLKALQRELPNLEVVRLLVEKFHVNINEYSCERGWEDDKYTVEPRETVLHYLAKGTHWWHVALAIPYLTSKGANINAKNSAGCTPLHLALGGPDQYVGPFHKDAARVLAAAGADLDAQDKSGQSCLASTAGDIDMIQLLIKYGVTIGADALLMAIKQKQVKVLQTLLNAGADPNMRCEAVDLNPRKKIRRHDNEACSDLHWDILRHEVYPLYAAAGVHRASNSLRNSSVEQRREDAREAVQLVMALLEAGADPYATFNKRNPDFEDDDGDAEDETVRALLSRRKNLNMEFEQVTILHDLLQEDDLVHPILNLTALDPNCRDAKGRTVLMAAAHNEHGLGAPIDSLFGISDSVVEPLLPSFLDRLLAQGADPMATDVESCNILHHIFAVSRHSTPRDISTLTRLAKDYPALVNQADMYGKTPLHLALRHAVLQCDTAPAEALLKVGADPSTVDNEGNSALHMLAFRIYASESIRSLFTTLLSRGLSINARNNRGETPIFNLNKHIPTHNPRLPEPMGPRLTAAEALSLFESAGANLFARDNEGQSLLHIAARETFEVKKTEDQYSFMFRAKADVHPEEKATARFEVLMGKGLDPLAEDGLKRTSLDVAAACGKESVLKLFEKDGGGGAVEE
jgi:ankyrin repeat protein